jgi:hypothetical protein
VFLTSPLIDEALKTFGELSLGVVDFLHATFDLAGPMSAIVKFRQLLRSGYDSRKFKERPVTVRFHELFIMRIGQSVGISW